MTRAISFLSRIDAVRQDGRPMLLGVCNVTPDSFSDGGLYLRRDDARKRVDSLLEEGADAIDMGAESTRPGAPSVSAAEQLDRLGEPLTYAVKAGALVSIDTIDAQVAAACLKLGAVAINDTSCNRENELGAVAAEYGAAYILMHARAPQAEMQGFSTYPDDGYKDVCAEVLGEWHAAHARLTQAGVSEASVLFDPGYGFSKNARQSFTLLRHTALLRGQSQARIVVGASRKSFLTLVDNAGPQDRLGASLGAAVYAARNGADVLRVHDVRATRQVLAALSLLESEVSQPSPSLHQGGLSP
jgi:dihydropteroate synthase